MADAEARGRSSREERRKADIRGEQKDESGVTAVGDEPGLGVGNEDDGDTVSSLLEKLSDLHVAIRMRHCQNLKLTNNAVLELQRQVAQCVKDTDPIFVSFVNVDVAGRRRAKNECFVFLPFHRRVR